MAVDKDKHTQILVTFPKDMVGAIEDHWHTQKFKNRNEAIRDLIAKGLNKKEHSE